jgi:hypothetical protein
VRQARENAGAILQAAQEAAGRLGGGAPAVTDGSQRTVEELQEQMAYLKTFGQAVRVQLRSYLEALIADVESEWGRADPAALPLEPPLPPAQRSGGDRGTPTQATFAGNTAGEAPPVTDVDEVVSAGAKPSP